MCSHHTVSRPSELLPKYHVGDLQLARDDPLVVASFEQDLGEGQFYAVLKKRVSAYFRDHKVSARCRRQAPQNRCLRVRGWASSWTHGRIRRCTSRLLSFFCCSPSLGTLHSSFSRAGRYVLEQ